MKYDIEDRLVNFASLIISLIESLPETKAMSHLGGQLLRSGTAPALIYGEAQGAESKNDFVHKMRIGLKELRETSVNLRIISNHTISEKLPVALKENHELIAIFVASIKTALSKQT